VGKRHRRIRARSATGQVAGAATEKPGLNSPIVQTAYPACVLPEGPSSQSAEPKPTTGRQRGLQSAVSCPDEQERSRDGCFASNGTSSSPVVGRGAFLGPPPAFGRNRAIRTRAVPRGHHFGQFHATCGVCGLRAVLLEAVSLQDFRGRSRVACNYQKIVVSPVRVRVSPSTKGLQGCDFWQEPSPDRRSASTLPWAFSGLFGARSTGRRVSRRTSAPGRPSTADRSPSATSTAGVPHEEPGLPRRRSSSPVSTASACEH
jgi:hypothetical protein